MRYGRHPIDYCIKVQPYHALAGKYKINFSAENCVQMRTQGYEREPLFGDFEYSYYI